MPAILRIFPYQTDASLGVLGLIGSYGQGAGRFWTEPPCNTMPWAPYFRGVRYLFRMYWATPRSMKMAVQNKKCVIIKYARSPVFMGQVVTVGNGQIR